MSDCAYFDALLAARGRRPDFAIGRYLGFQLVVTERTVDVYRHDGRHIGTAYSLSGARRICRGYRGASR